MWWVLTFLFINLLRYNLYMNKYNNVDFLDKNFCNLGVDYMEAMKKSKEDLPNLELIYSKQINFFQIEKNNKLSNFISKFDYLDYKLKISFFNSFECIKSFLAKDIITKDEKINIFLSNNIKLTKTQINFIEVGDYKVPFDNLLIFSLFQVCKLRDYYKEVYEFLNSLNRKLISDSTFDIISGYLNRSELEFVVYKNQEEINNNLVEPQFLKTKNTFNLPFGAFSNIFNNISENKNLRNINDIEKYVNENKSNSYLLSIENNPKEIFKIVKNHSFVKHFLSDEAIIRYKKYLFNKNYWTKFFDSLINALPFAIPDEDKQLEISYDNEKFRVIKINSKIINFENNISSVINKIIVDKSINSKGYDLSIVIEQMIIKEIIKIDELFKKYELNKSKLKYCSLEILDLMKKSNKQSEKEINIEITNRKITDKFNKITSLLTNGLNQFEQSLIIVKNDTVDIFSTARSIRAFIELISKLFIIDQVLKCYSDKNKDKYEIRIQNLSKKLDKNLALHLIKICFNPYSYEIYENIDMKRLKNNEMFEILHLKYHLEKFNDKFCFNKDSFGFSEEIYNNFISKIIRIFKIEILNFFAHSFHWFHNDMEIERLSGEIIEGINKFVSLSRTDYFNTFITQLNSIYEFLSNKDNSLEKFFSTSK